MKGRSWLTNIIVALVLLGLSIGTPASTSLMLFPVHHIKQMSKKFSHVGTIETTSDGFVYVKISQDYINNLYPLIIKKISKSQAQCLHPNENIVGAHISLFYPHTHSKNKIKSLLGKKIYFTLKEGFLFQYYNLHTHKLEKYLGVHLNSKSILTVVAPYLSMQKENKYIPHITLGIGESVQGRCMGDNIKKIVGR